MPSRQKNTGLVDNIKTSFEHRDYANGQTYDQDDPDGTKTQLPAFYIEQLGKSWGNTPGFFTKKRNHERLPDNSFTLIKEQLPDSYVSFTVIAGPYTPDPEVFNPWLVVSGRQIEHFHIANICGMRHSSRMLSDLKARERLMNKARSNQWNVPVFLAEGRKTIQMVEKTAITFVTALRQLKKGNIVAFGKTLGLVGGPRGVSDFNRNFPKNRVKAVSNAWLEHRYGWLPFMQDVHSAMNTLMDLSERPDAHLGKVVGNDKMTSEFFSAQEIVEVSPETRANIKTTVEESVRVVWKFEAKPENVLGRLGLLNPLEVAWELVPLSFVADWFLPIGSYLSGLGDGLRFVHAGGTSGYKCVTTTSYIDVNRRTLNNPEAKVFVIGSGNGIAKHTRVERNILGEIPSPRLSDMTVSTNLSPIRMISGIALLAQQLR